MRVLGQLLCVLFVVGLIAKYIWWILVIAAVVAAAKYLPPIAKRHQVAAAEQAGVERARVAALAARADQQHNWTMQGDARGVYGAYPPDCWSREAADLPPREFGLPWKHARCRHHRRGVGAARRGALVDP